MQRDFRYLRDKYGDAGARDIFEKICIQLYQTKFEQAYPIDVHLGDGGIDIYIGNFEDQIDVYQCKYFLDGIGVYQQNQIRKSFNTAAESTKYKLKDWYLCVPCVLNIDETKWWYQWKTKMKNQYGINIILRDGSYLLNDLKKYNLYNNNFDNDIALMLEEIREFLFNSKRYYEEQIYELEDLDDMNYDDCIFVKKLQSAQIYDNKMAKQEFFNAEIIKSSIESKDNDEGTKMYKNLRTKILSIWNSQYIKYKDEVDGKSLLSDVYQRIEDLDTTTLKAREDISLIAKKGILHQLSDECKVGWVKNYSERLEQYIKGEEK
ncbi:hypothetical protein [Clostridium omnivorum]|uniref:Restriction endonuclease type IV Mrr domain-containing protein n=1 Tax=Clostridium omnivorum TaxID=1604902 RepID=A0ABQ5N7Z0_9CLOT|nr:hypothetical protein [Clostridium sp. E14]GLC31150.1 hypothetical protein bsdE14_25600 [Clostridium sp. E14]